MYAANRFGCDATHWAGARGCVRVLEWLRDQGFDLAAANDQKHTALSKAAYKGHSAAEAWLREHLATTATAEDK